MRFKSGQLIRWKNEEKIKYGRRGIPEPSDPIFLLLECDDERWKALGAEGNITSISKDTIEEWMEIISET